MAESWPRQVFGFRITPTERFQICIICGGYSADPDTHHERIDVWTILDKMAQRVAKKGAPVPTR